MRLKPSGSFQVRRLAPDAILAGARELAVETPVAISFLGIGYAVMMASPLDLEDFGYGFAASERIIERSEQVTGITILEEERGLLLNIEVSPDRQELVLQRVRHRAGESSCGLCGIENLDQALRPLPRVERPPDFVARPALFEALRNIRDHQPVNRSTGAVHAAALFGTDGALVAAREDVGRHNAFDKLIGHCLREAIDPTAGFALLTSRCSYELVEKAALAGIPLLVTVSAPTSLAIERAREAGLTLIALARQDEMLVVSDPYSLFA
ncbi:formate dehydrogenase accessory sulfurtransferase FdhD [Sphingosinicella rhizophila]|uniref:Sulfur carrier protein FdhD n=1 Tax=Sphingosinicella rhizophila TaxID=3050082 RepID=A0ABU3Q5V1_9SPHN|nr:formate dehydrogenase accessory sulfurtransferase FdhD [Sphingosinicella sp. GR2756]MDT9598788.1 formate dehydrogenase accessory sulfurtransferase FdhD [Sphingosinicella sp. GR2756]